MLKRQIFRHDGRGELIRLNWSHFARDSHLDAPIDQVIKVDGAPKSGDQVAHSAPIDQSYQGAPEPFSGGGAVQSHEDV